MLVEISSKQKALMIDLFFFVLCKNQINKWLT